MILIVGGNGMLGRDLMALLGNEARGVDIGDIDITSLESSERIIRTLHPSIVINCAAYTNVDGCEKDVETAMQVNGEGVAHLAIVTRGVGAKLVHISTDYIFDGCKGSPYLEDDPPNPLCIYGESKLAGEMNAAFNPEHLIIRTQWLYGSYGNNFVETMLRLAGDNNILDVVDDQIGSPTWTVDLSRAIIALVLKGCTGTYHAANCGYVSWNCFAKAIFEESGLDTVVRGMTTEQLNRPARRPLYSTLDCSKLERDAGFRLQPWRDALKAYLVLRK
jgi:dTDP-4-dehydrorhamnose reductase